ncbi:AcrR family transcriptional regulator [Okibacterium sp. HSC-33S16]|uniref:TetR/AcrR family transcriptional regulator n=1 Tax=Okibacterium sp. HSC-33S16 TaxID=2910965 RepID=UPI0020A1D8B7|nr:TetR family transcriptional regulator [Okibacterium sp. HSC-33S16]MCP2031661.1 AcrR family transcriptional regulator [Okibacterium sp. HSC-33S16]
MSTAPTSSSRSYTSSLRSEQAAQTRQRILDSAAECFATNGYAGTSLADIAHGAGVSVETVKLSGPKRQLLLSAFEQRFSGSEGREPLTDRADARAVLEIADNDEFLLALVRFIAQANARTSGLWSAYVSAATSDAVIGESLLELLKRRRNEYRAAITTFDDRRMLSTDVNRHELADALSFLMSPESYAELVEQAGWSTKRYVDWQVHAIRRIVLEA